jgi:hypothetical protein
MKKILLIGSALTLISTSAMASQARLLALGMKETDNDGMYHISDARNIFLNPAYVNLYSNYATVEFGKFGAKAATTPTTAPGAATVDQYQEPKAQGGAFRTVGDLVYGVYLGNESNTSSLLRVVGTSAAAILDGATSLTPGLTFGAGSSSKMLQTTDNQVDIFIGGDAGIKWGANALYAHGSDETRSAKDTAIATRFGLIGSNWDAHLNLSLASKAESSDALTFVSAPLNETVRQEFKGKLGVQLGGSYVITGNNRVFGYVKHYGWEQTDSYSKYASFAGIGGQSGTVKGDFTSYYLGWGTHTDVNTTDKVYVSLAAKKTDVNVKFASKGEVRHLVVPLTLSYEATATEWLVLRGSIIQNIYGKRDNKGLGSLNLVAQGLITPIYGGNGKTTLANSTEVNAGATLKFGNLALDGLVGTTGSTGTSNSKTGVLSLENLLTKAALTYNF